MPLNLHIPIVYLNIIYNMSLVVELIHEFIFKINEDLDVLQEKITETVNVEEYIYSIEVIEQKIKAFIHESKRAFEEDKYPEVHLQVNIGVHIYLCIHKYYHLYRYYIL